MVSFSSSDSSSTLKCIVIERIVLSLTKAPEYNNDKTTESAVPKEEKFCPEVDKET